MPEQNQPINNMSPIPEPDLRELNNYRNTKDDSDQRGPKPGDRAEDLAAIGLQGAVPKSWKPANTPAEQPEDWREQLKDATKDLPEDQSLQP